ncbi:MAG TPA: TadE/TadG family type IV pilus assembly protein [Phenylobacterium sp.]|nr:TadE/TadG family type IV pilus assembly protein [Phenylobacterium sp.]
MHRTLKRIRHDERGVAAVEFALLAPIMILLYCGLAELTIAMMAERRAAHSASVVADLVAQQTNGTNITDLGDIFTIGNSIMYPFPTGSLKMRLTSVVADNNAVPKMAWSLGHGLTKMGAGTVAGVPVGLLAAGDSVIQADVQYTFTSPLKYVMHNDVTFNDTYYLKPRSGTAVACSDCPP